MKPLTYDSLEPYQKTAIATGVNLEQLALFLGTGLGKTIIALGIVDQLMKRGRVKNTLIVAPKKTVFHTWRQEAALWEPTKYLTFSIIHHNWATGPSNVVKRRALFHDSDIKLINYEGLPWLAETLVKLKYDNINAKWPFQCVIYDESTKLKHSTTQRFRKFKHFMALFDYRFIMTGTPTPNGLGDLFGQMFLLDQGLSLGTSLKNFRNRYMIPVEIEGTRVYKPLKNARLAITRRIQKHVLYMKKEDYLTLPPIKYNPIGIDLPKELEQDYQDLETQFFLDLGSAKIEAFSAASLSMKLRQFLQGRLYYHDADGKVTTKHLHDEKLDYIRDLVDTSAKKTRILEGIGNCIIAYNFKFEREDLRTVFPNAPAIDGRTTHTEATSAFKAWNKGELPVLLYNPASDPHGLNLQFGGNQILWYSLTWNLEHFIQLIDRLHRRHQTTPVFVHLLLFRGTIDFAVYSALTAKEREQTSLLAALKKWQIATRGNQKGKTYVK